MNIGPRIALFAALLVLVSALSVGLIVYTRINQLLIQEEIENLEDSTHLFAVRLTNRFDTLRRDSQLMARLPSVAEMVRARSAGGADPVSGYSEGELNTRLVSTFAALLRSKPAYSEIRLVDVTGRELLAVRRDQGRVQPVPGAELIDQSAAPWFRLAVGSSEGRTITTSIAFVTGKRELGKRVARAATAIRVDGLGRAVVAVDINFDELIEQVLQGGIEHPPEAVTYVTDSAGDFLYHPNPAQRFGFAYGRPQLIQAEFPSLEPLFRPGGGEQTVVTGADHGELLFFTKVHIDPEHPGNFLGLAAAAPYRVVIGPYLQVRRQTLLLALLLVVVGVLLAVLFARLLTRPIGQLTRAAREVADGRLEVRLPVEYRHEVGVLARAFESMIAQLREREQSVREKTEELTRVNRELEQFVYIVSHDLKAPLRAVSNLSTWIEEDLGPKLTGEEREYLALMRGRVARMDAFIEGLLALSRAGRITSEPERVDSAELIQEIVATFEPNEVTVAIASELPVLDTDRLRLSQVLSNLIGNAIKHGKGPGGHVWVSCRSVAGGFFEFAVRDDGPGIAPEHLMQIFQVFQTLGPADEKDNTGIGLSIVKKIVEGLGGRVSVESTVGEGSTFRFTWPKYLPPTNE